MTPLILTLRLHAFHWLVFTAFYVVVLHLSSVGEIQSVRCCLRCWTVDVQWQSHGLRGSGCFNMLIHAHFFRLAILTRKVGQNDAVFGVRSRFISRSVHATLQVSL